jgi:hypothetical protein
LTSIAARFTPGGRLLQQLQPFAADRRLDVGDAGDISARPRQARDETARDRVGDMHKDDRGCLRRLLQGVDHCRRLAEDGVRMQRRDVRGDKACMGLVSG